MAKRKAKDKMVVLFARRYFADKININQLFDICTAFNLQWKMFKDSAGNLIIYSYNDIYQRRLLAMLPLMPDFEAIEMEIKEQEWRELKLEEALGEAIE